MAFVLKISLGEDLRRISVPDYSVFTYSNLCETLYALFGKEMPKDYTVQYIDDEGDEIVVSSDDELCEGFRVAMDDNRKSLRIRIISTAAPLAPKPNVMIPPLPRQSSNAELDTPPVSPRAIPRERAQDKPISSEMEDNTEKLSEETEKAEVKKPLQKHSEETLKTEHDVVVHNRVACDGCGMCPIRGVRFKSSVIEDFDLCNACEDEGHYEATHAPFLKIRTPEKAPETIVTILGSNAPNWRRHNRHGNGAGHWGRRNRGCRWQQQQQQQQICVPTSFQQAAEKAAEKASDNGTDFQAAIANSFLSQTVSSVKKGQTPPAVRPMARFVTDVTIPDGTKVKTGTKFVKIWLLRNDGKAAWPVGSRLMPVGGDNMVSGEAASDGVLVVPASREVLPGQEVEVSMELTAPAKPGRYVGHFRMQIGDQRFGHRVWADVVVEQPEQLPEQLPAQEEPKMDISQDVVLAVSAKLRDIQAHRSEATEAESPSSPSFVMVPMPETLLAMPEVDSAAPVAVAAPPLNSAPPAYVHTLSPPVENTPALPAPPAPPAPHTPVPAPSLPDSVTVTPVVAPVAAADLIDAAVHGQNNTKFQDQLNQLADMGFFDKKLLTEMLEAEMGDIQRVVERLLL